MSHAALLEAVERAGSQSELARKIETSQQSVSYWVSKHKPMPAEYVLRAEKELGLSRHFLRPDIYPAIDHVPTDTGNVAPSSPGNSDEISARVAS